MRIGAVGRRLQRTLAGLVLMATMACASGGDGPPPLDFTTVRSPGALGGAWVGGTDVMGGYTLVEADFRRNGEHFTGQLRAPSQNVSGLPVMEAEVTGAEVRFSFRSPFGVHRASGNWDGGMIFGRIRGGGLSGDFHLVPVRPPDPEASTGRAGSYSEREGHRLLVTPRSGGGLAWSETELLEDGAMSIAGGTMYGYSADTVFTDRSIRAEPRVHEWAAFRGDTAIEWHPETRPVRITHRTPMEIVQDEVTLTNGNVELSGTLLLPPGPGPHPAVVHVHGSGPAERTNLLGLLRADLLLRRGIGVLVYDKRGVGGSSGSWEESGVEELAGDAAAGVALLRAHPAVDTGAVGLFGHSQAGWVIPAAAARRPDADFLIVLSGGGVSPREQEMFRARAAAAGAGLAADSAESLMELKWRYAETGEGWDAYLAAVATADPRIVALVEAPTDEDPARWSLVRKLAPYDPLPHLRAIRVPTLVVFGMEDDNVPVDRAEEIWREVVDPSLLIVEVVPGVGHAVVGIREGRGSVFPAELVRALDGWLEARGLTEASRTKFNDTLPGSGRGP